MFQCTGIKISAEGDRHLGAVVGTSEFREKFVTEKVRKWVQDVHQLSEIAKDEPQAAYCAYTKGLCHRWSFLQRTVKDINHLFKPLEDAIYRELMPTIIGRALTELELQIIELPVRYGGLGIKNPRKSAEEEFKNSQFVTEALTQQIFMQDRSSPVDLKIIASRKQLLKDLKEAAYKSKLSEIVNSTDTPPHLTRLLKLATEKGAGAWLTALPIQTLGYALNKEDFRGSLCIRYGWRIKNMSLHCACGSENSINHSLICKIGGYSIFRHNIVRDSIADILKEICREVKVEPELIPIDSDFNINPAENSADKARLDVSSVGLWSPLQKNFMDIRVFHPNAPSYQSKSIQSLYKDHERRKKAAYNSRVIQVEKSSFTPMVFSTFGGMGAECSRALQRAAGMLAEKRSERYADVMGYISTKIRMCLLRTVLMSVRGSRGTSKGTGKPISSVAFNLIPGIEEMHD